MKDKYKVVIVGFAHVHINDVAKHFYEHPRIDLCGAADVPPHMPEMKPGAIYTREWNIYCCKNYNIPKFDDWKQMLDEVKPDLCVVNSENCYHVQITEECAKRGIGVSIEKPMATTMSDAMKMYRIVKKYGTFYMVNWPITWNPGLLEKCWPGLSLLAFGHAGVGTAGVRDLLDRLERGMAEDRWPGQQAPFKRALADALAQRGALDAALRANDPRAAHRASEALEDALTEMEDSLLAAGSGPKRKKPSLFRRLFGLR